MLGICDELVLPKWTIAYSIKNGGTWSRGGGSHWGSWCQDGVNLTLYYATIDCKTSDSSFMNLYTYIFPLRRPSPSSSPSVIVVPSLQHLLRPSRPRWQCQGTSGWTSRICRPFTPNTFPCLFLIEYLNPQPQKHHDAALHWWAAQSAQLEGSPVAWEEEPSTEASRITKSPSIYKRWLERDIRDQLRALRDSQNAAHDLLEGLQTRPEDYTGELAACLQHTETPIQTLMDQSYSCGPEIPQVVPPSRTVWISDSMDPLRRLRSLSDIGTQHTPLPTAAPAGSSVAQQLDINPITISPCWMICLSTNWRGMRTRSARGRNHRGMRSTLVHDQPLLIFVVQEEILLIGIIKLNNNQRPFAKVGLSCATDSV